MERLVFPGGKMEVGETPEEALVREIREELSAEISVEFHSSSSSGRSSSMTRLSMMKFWRSMVFLPM